jgi:hypothetical protein
MVREEVRGSEGKFRSISRGLPREMPSGLPRLPHGACPVRCLRTARSISRGDFLILAPLSGPLPLIPPVF